MLWVFLEILESVQLWAWLTFSAKIIILFQVLMASLWCVGDDSCQGKVSWVLGGIGGSLLSVQDKIADFFSF